MADLKPCPLCGSTDIACFAEECGDDYDNVPTFRAVVGCRGCHEEGCDPSCDDEPCFGIEAYFRADHPLIRDEEDPSDCERVLERHMAERWNRRAGSACEQRRTRRTCRDVGGFDKFVCSECGASLYMFGMYDDPTYWVDDVAAALEYCPSCGAKVVSE